MAHIENLSGFMSDLKKATGEQVIKLVKLPDRLLTNAEKTGKKVLNTSQSAVTGITTTAQSVAKSAGSIGTGLVLAAAALAAIVLFTQKDTIGDIAKKKL